MPFIGLHATSLAAVCALALAGCAGKGPRGTPDNEPTLATLAGREVAVVSGPAPRGSEEQTIAAYRKFLDAAPNAPQRPEAMRRLGDLEMDVTDNKLADGSGGQTPAGAPDYRAAVARYQTYLLTYPTDPRNDRVLYQLARAQEQAGDLDKALKTLDRLVAEYPTTAARAEAQFRRGELLFAKRDYARAETAYATVLASDASASFEERALYMRGWSVFKQGRLDEALVSFFGVLDAHAEALSGTRVDDQASDGDDALDDALDHVTGLSRGERELVEDTFRVTSLSLANLQGAESIPAYVGTAERRGYEFRIYQQLGELYIRQGRVKDAADTLGAFARRQPLHAQAPVLQTRVIEIYESNGFASLALAAKKDYVSRYGAASEFRRANPAGWQRAQPLVKTHLAELARHHHAAAQKTKASADVQEAVTWYRATLASFPDDPAAASANFLLAELLFDNGKLADAAVEYEKTAYGHPAHARSADAGYAALLSYASQAKRLPVVELPAIRRAGVESALRFGAAFAGDVRTGSVLADAAEQLFALGDGARAAGVAQQVLALQPPAAPAQRRVAHTVLAHTAFERGAFADAEAAYARALALVPAADAGRTELVERQAAAVYKQGEQAKAQGDARDAVGHFARVAALPALAPQSTVRATAQYDAAAVLIGLQDWDGATRQLEEFRQRHPQHPLADDVSGKLAVAYLEREQWALAANEFDRLSATQQDPKLARDALWQAAELHHKAALTSPNPAAARVQAARTYERYLKQFPEPVEPALEARARMANLAKADGNAARELALMREIYAADRASGSDRTPRTRYLGATAALALAEPKVAEYRKVALVEPLAKQLAVKKAKFEDVLRVYALATEYGVADVITATTHHTAALYQDFGRALMASQRPKKLNKAELEQYDLLLEEQADPFVEKAVELHEANVRRAADGVYDEWVKASFKALGEMRPVRYGKAERAEGVVDAIR